MFIYIYDVSANSSSIYFINILP